VTPGQCTHSYVAFHSYTYDFCWPFRSCFVSYRPNSKCKIEVSNPPYSVCNNNMRKRGRSAPIWRKKACLGKKW
jgi:hypothetical protein